MNETISAGNCARCGTCCKKGGPSFHHADRHLIEQGRIPARFLFTIRKHEMVYDNVREMLLPAPSDIIKIRGQGKQPVCRFFALSENGCTIYPDRPLECRVLRCWDTREIETVYGKDRLTRQDILGSVQGLWDLVADHQNRCGYEEIEQLVHGLNNGGGGEARRRLQDIIHYDRHLRMVLVEKERIKAEMADFLFGRPIAETIHAWGVRIEQDGDRLRIIQTRQRTGSVPVSHGRRRGAHV